MARKQKNSVDYFPHDVNHGKKMHFIEGKYKNDGYAVWHKLLEELGKSEYHYIDITDEITLMYLSSSFNVSEGVLKSIIGDLVKLGDFDKKLYENGILYNQKFVDSITDAYKKRTNDIVDRSSLLTLLQSKGVLKPPKSRKKPPKGELKGDGNTQSKVKDTKEDEIKVYKSKLEEKIFEFFEFRIKLKKPIIEASKDAWLKKLNNLSGGNEDMAIQILDESIADGYQGIFQLKNNNNEKSITGDRQTPNNRAIEEF